MNVTNVTSYQYAYKVARRDASEIIARKKLKHKNIYLWDISLLFCISPSSDITISSRRKIHGGQKYRSYVTGEIDRVLQFDQCHVIVVSRSHLRVIFRMHNDFVDWDYLLGSFHCTKILFTCWQFNKMF